MTPSHGRHLFAAAALALAAAFALGNPRPPAAPKATAAPKADRYGDLLPAGAVARLGTVRLRHGAGIFPIAFAPDGKAVAVAGGSPWVQQGVDSADNSIRLFDVASGKEVLHLKGHPGAVTALAFFPDGKTLIAGTAGDTNLRLWALPGGGEPQLIPFSQNGGSLPAFAVSPDGKTLAFSGGSELAVHLRNLTTGQERRGLIKPSAPVNSLAFTPDGKGLAGKSAGVVRLWDAATGQAIRKFRPKTYYAKQKRLGIETAGANGMPTPSAPAPVLFTPDGKTLVAEAGDNTIHVWDVASGKELRQLVHRGPIIAAAFTPDGKTLATGCVDNAVRLWDVTTGRELRHLEGHFGGYMGVAVAPDGKTLATAGGDHTVHLWNLATGKELHRTGGHQGEIINAAFAAGGKTIITAGRDNALRVWEAGGGKELRRLPDPAEIIDLVALAPDGKTLAIASAEDETVQLWDVAAGNRLHELSARVAGVAFSPDGKRLALLGEDSALRLWEPGSGKGPRPLEGIPSPFVGFAFAPDGKALALGGADNSLRLWGLEGKELKQFEPLPQGETQISDLEFSPDGKVLLSLHANNLFHLWDVAGGKHLHRLVHAADRAFGNMDSSAAFSPDGRMLATTGSGDATIRLWEVATGRERQQLTGHRGPVNFVTFSPDGRFLASGGWDTTVLIWDAIGPPPSGLAELGVKDLEALWADLASDDAAKAYRALCRLAHAPRQAVPLLQKQLGPAMPVGKQHIARLIADLDSDQFTARQNASAELERLGNLAEPELRNALKGQVSLEVRRRVTQLLEKLQGPVPTTDRLRAGRALELIERIGTPEAKRLLEQLAAGAPQARLSQDAKAALERLAKRNAN
jgi:WD40 repeat protein